MGPNSFIKVGPFYLVIVTQAPDGSVLGYSLYLGNGVPGFQLADGNGTGICSTSPASSCTNYGANTSVSDGQWHFITVTVDRDMIGTFYIDGVVDATFNPTFRPDTLDNLSPLRMGVRTLALTSFFSGEMDEVEIFKRVLTQNEILDLFTAGSRGKCKDCLQPPSGMVAWWPLDEVFGTTAADIERGHQGVYVNGPVPQPGKVAAGLRFDGQNDYVEVQDHSDLDMGTGDFSIDLWVKTTTTTGGIPVLVEKRTQDAAGNVLGYSFYLFNGIPGFQLADGFGSGICGPGPTSSCTNYGANTFVADGLWHHLAVTVDRDGIGNFYIDGVIDATFNPTVRPGTLDNQSPLRIGVRTLALTSFFTGEMDEIEIFKRVLTQQEVRALAGAGSRGKCKTNCDSMRLIAHVTNPNGTFTTHSLTTNGANGNKNYQLYGFDAGGVGAPVTAIAGSIGGSATVNQTTATLFGNTDVSHFFIRGSENADFLMEYTANTGGNPAHVGETTQQAKAWRVVPGDWNLVFDGLAIVNVSAGSVNITISQLDSSGNSVSTPITLAPLVSLGKSLVVLNNNFNAVPGSVFEIRANRPIAVMAMRFIQPSSEIMWENAAIPIH